MPTYEYQCSACEYRFERFQSMSAAPVRKCPACGKRKVQRLISGGGAIIFKGAGFYITDYRSDSYKQAAGKDAPPAAADVKSGSKIDAKSEPKSDAKADAKAAPATSATSAAPPAESKPAKSAKPSRSKS